MKIMTVFLHKKIVWLIYLLLNFLKFLLATGDNEKKKKKRDPY